MHQLVTYPVTPAPPQLSFKRLCQNPYGSLRFGGQEPPVSYIPGADCGSYHELLIAKFRFKLKKVVAYGGGYRGGWW